MSTFPWRALRQPLQESERARLQQHLRALVAWQRDLKRWPKRSAAPNADPFVSIYASGALRGCYGSAEGPATERIQRAFLLAANDARFAPLVPSERAHVVAQVSYGIRPRTGTPAALLARLEPGVHGMAILLADGRHGAVLPEVTRDHSLTAAALLAAVRGKVGLDAEASPRGTRYFMFESETVSSRAPTRTSASDPIDLAAAWLMRQVGSSGAIGFGLNPRTGAALPRGQMFHGRVAAVLEALERCGMDRTRLACARRWLAREIARGLRGELVEAWPNAPAAIAGTLALAARAGMADALHAPLLALARSSGELAAVPWHAAQVVATLGLAAPRALWRACVRDLERQPVAPWTLLAAAAVGDHAVRDRCEAALIDAVRSAPPHAGAVLGAAVPELGLTAMVATALETCGSRRARAAADRANDFLARWQLVAQTLPAALDPQHALGAFPLSPIHYPLRSDVTAHALLALCARRDRLA